MYKKVINGLKLGRQIRPKCPYTSATGLSIGYFTL